MMSLEGFEPSDDIFKVDVASENLDDLDLPYFGSIPSTEENSRRNTPSKFESEDNHFLSTKPAFPAKHHQPERQPSSQAPIRLVGTKNIPPQISLPTIELTEGETRVGKALFASIDDETLQNDLFEILVAEDQSISCKPLVDGLNLEQFLGTTQSLRKNEYTRLENGDCLWIGNTYSFRLEMGDTSFADSVKSNGDLHVHEDEETSNIEFITDVEDVTANSKREKRQREDEPPLQFKRQRTEDNSMLELDEFLKDSESEDEIDKEIPKVETEIETGNEAMKKQVSVPGVKVSQSRETSESISPIEQPEFEKVEDEVNISEVDDVEITGDDQELSSTRVQSLKNLDSPALSLFQKDLADFPSETSFPNVADEQQESQAIQEQDQIVFSSVSRIDSERLGTEIAIAEEPIKADINFWQNVSTELMCWIFSCGILEVVDTVRCLRVCKTWYMVCNDNQIWRIVCLNKWNLALSYQSSPSDMFIEKQFEWKGICKLRRLLSATRELLQSCIDEGYSIMAKLLSSRDEADKASPSCFHRVAQMLETMRNDVAVEEYIREYEEMVDKDVVHAEEREDMFFLVNNVFVTIRQAEIPGSKECFTCTVITKDAKILRFSLNFFDSVDSLSKPFQISYTSDSEHGILFDHSGSPKLNKEALSMIRNKIGLSLSKKRLFFFLWKYCLLHDISLYKETVGKYFEEIGWSWDAVKVFLPMGDTAYQGDNAEVEALVADETDAAESYVPIEDTTMSEATSQALDTTIHPTTDLQNETEESEDVDIL